jgi:hypothetical protein
MLKNIENSANEKDRPDLKRQSTSTRQHDAISQKAVIFILAAART